MKWNNYIDCSDPELGEMGCDMEKCPDYEKCGYDWKKVVVPTGRLGLQAMAEAERDFYRHLFEYMVAVARSADLCPQDPEDRISWGESCIQDVRPGEDGCRLCWEHAAGYMSAERHDAILEEVIKFDESLPGEDVD